MGRKINSFKTSAGEFVCPEKIELLLLSKPGVKSASITENKGRPAAVLQLSAPPYNIAEIIADVNRELPAYMRISEYSVADGSANIADSNWKRV